MDAPTPPTIKRVEEMNWLQKEILKNQIKELEKTLHKNRNQLEHQNQQHKEEIIKILISIINDQKQDITLTNDDNTPLTTEQLHEKPLQELTDLLEQILKETRTHI